VRVRDSILDCIGGTPLVRLSRFAPEARATLAAKLEMLNPYSIKDRPALYMIREAEGRGEVGPGSVVVEASSGNTAIGLAAICAIRGYRLIVCMSEIQSVERRRVLLALGAELELTPASEGTKGARRRARELCEEVPGAYYVCQHSNRDNPQAHAETTAEELWRDTDGEIDVLVAGLGTTGTVGGVARVIKERKPSFRVVGIEPEQAPVLSQGTFRPHRMMGTAPGWVPDLYDASLVDEIVLVSEEDAFEGCRRLARREGILAGITSGATAHVARELARRAEYEGKLIVCVLADTGERYLTVEGLF
jgi:cysteine synthase A